MNFKERIKELDKEIGIDERPIKDIIREWLLRTIALRRNILHLLTLQDIELKETKKNNTYLRKEKNKYKDMYGTLDKDYKKLQIEFNNLVKEYERLERKVNKYEGNINKN